MGSPNWSTEFRNKISQPLESPSTKLPRFLAQTSFFHLGLYITSALKSSIFWSNITEKNHKIKTLESVWAIIKTKADFRINVKRVESNYFNSTTIIFRNKINFWSKKTDIFSNTGLARIFSQQAPKAPEIVKYDQKKA